MGIPSAEKTHLLSRYDSWSSIPAMAMDMLLKGGNKPFLWWKPDGKREYEQLTHAQIRELVLSLSHGLISAGLKPGERVVLASENRPEWLISDIAIMLAGGVSVPAYATNTEKDHTHIITDSGAVGLITSGGKVAEQALAAAAVSDQVRFTIAFDSNNQDAQLLAEICARHKENTDPPSTLNSIRRSDLSSLIYTSGTGGSPKGVMLSHRAILANCKSALDLVFDLDEIDDLQNESFLSFLPLSHAYERTCGQFFPLSAGCQIYYAEGLDKLGANLLEAKPTIMTAVPRLYESLHARILQGLKKESKLKQKLFQRAVQLGRKKVENSPLSILEKIENFFLNKFVRKKVQGRFGGQLKALISGGAPLNYDVGIFFASLGLRLLQGYGQTEAAPVISCNRPGTLNLETVGPKLLGVELKLASDGEILVAGDLLMDGYWNRPAETAETIKDGWLYTGDIGEFDELERLKITDRKKDLIVNAGGDNISPQRVEGVLTLHEAIDQAMVFGDKKPHLVALINPAKDFAELWAASNGVSRDILLANDKFRQVISEAVDEANMQLSPIERIRRFILVNEAFTIENGLLTPTMKIRRRFITDLYKEQLESLYPR